MGFINLGGEKSFKEIRACALVSLSDFSPPLVYKSHILNRTINKLYLLTSEYQYLLIWLLYFLLDTLTPSYVPVKPFPMPPTNPPALEIEEFVPEKGQLSNPHSSYANNLYVYPLSLKFDSQKSFTKVGRSY